MKFSIIISLLLSSFLCFAQSENEAWEEMKKASLEDFTAKKDKWLNNAAKDGDKNIVGWLINQGVDVQKSNALHIAIRNNQLETMYLLIDKGADVNRINEKNLNGLHIAAMFSNSKMFEAVLELTDDVNLRCGSGATALALADLHGRFEHVSSILSHPGVDVKSTHFKEVYCDGATISSYDYVLINRCQSTTKLMILQYLVNANT